MILTGFIESNKTYLNMVIKNFIITYVVHNIFLLDSITCHIELLKFKLIKIK